jgi:hypothetical protein
MRAEVTPVLADAGLTGKGANIARVAEKAPFICLTAAMAYLVSPINFWLLFRNTDWLNAYPSRTDLALAAAPALGLLAVGGLTLLVSHPIAAIRAAWAGPLAKAIWLLGVIGVVSGVYGLLRHNSFGLIASDFLPIAELIGFFFLTINSVKSVSGAMTVALWTVGSLVITIVLRVYFFLPAVDALPRFAAGYQHGLYGTGVTALFVIGRIMPRLPLLQSAAWLLPFTLAYTFRGPDTRIRLALGVATAILGIAIYLSFERGLWLFAAVGGGVVVLEGLRSAWRRPPSRRSLLAGLAIGLLAYAGLAAVIRAEPATTALDRLGYTFVQLNSVNPVSHKRQDELKGILADLWPGGSAGASGGPRPALLVLGLGLGATYQGPTGSLDTNYVAQAHDTKHYTYDTYLAVLLRMGIVGELGLLIAFGVFALYACLVWWRSPTPVVRILGAAATGALAGVAVMSFVDPYLLAHPITIFEGATAALLVRVAPPGPWSRWAAAIARSPTRAGEEPGP